MNHSPEAQQPPLADDVEVPLAPDDDAVVEQEELERQPDPQEEIDPENG